MAAQLGGQGRRAVARRDRRVGPDGRAGPVVARCRGDGRRHRGPDRCHAVGRGGFPASDHRIAGDADRRGRTRNRHDRRRRHGLVAQRPGGARRHRDRRPGHPVPRRHEHPRRNLAGAAGGPRRHHRPARGPLVGVPRRAAAGRARREGPHPRRLPEGHQGLRLRVLRGGQDRSRQHRPAAADGAGADLGGARARPHPGVEPARRGRRRLCRRLQQRLPASWRCPTRPTAHPYAITGTATFDHRQPGVVLLRLPRPFGRRRHRLLELAGGDPSGGPGAAQRRVPTWRLPAASTR